MWYRRAIANRRDFFRARALNGTAIAARTIKVMSKLTGERRAGIIFRFATVRAKMSSHRRPYWRLRFRYHQKLRSKVSR